MRSFPQIRQVAAAITTSPRMVGMLAAAWHFRRAPERALAADPRWSTACTKQAEFREAMFQLIKAQAREKFRGLG